VRSKMASTALAAAVALTLAGCGGGSGGESGGKPLKIGILLNKSGVLSATSADAQKGYELAAEQAASQLGGRKVELVEIEHDGTPAGTAAAAMQMIQQKGVKLLTGPNTTAQGLAVGPVVTRLGGVWIDSTSQGSDTTGKSCQPSYFRVVLTVHQYVQLFAAYLKDSPVKNWAFIGSDYAFGRDMGAGIKEKAAAAGGKVTKEIYSPLGNADFGTAISQLAGDGAKGLVTALSGSDAATFSKQAVQFDLFKKYDVVVGDGLLGNLPTAQLPSVAHKMTNAVEIAGNYNPDLQTAENKQYLALWQKKYPGQDYESLALKSVNYYNAVSTYVQAVAVAKSDDGLKVRAALAGGRFTYPQGTVTIRAQDHQALLPGLVTTAKEAGGGWKFKISKNYTADQIEAPVDGCKL
jgi:branched-chain amino acid transport system substrate-binding protein